MIEYIGSRIKELEEELKTLPDSSEDAYYCRGAIDAFEEIKQLIGGK